jgi:hypothetical protein
MENLGQDLTANALELAIFSEAKKFLKIPLCQKVLRSIEIGEVVYIPSGTRSLVRDDYKTKPVHIYSPRGRPVRQHACLPQNQIDNDLSSRSSTTTVYAFLFIATISNSSLFS